jgi:2-dehydro-3-deoxyphosphogluconate aldolase / (4S)-4-hydroxy-2-oxoglutarate aldolase
MTDAQGFVSRSGRSATTDRNRSAALARIADIGVLAVLRGPDPERTLAGIDALVDGGIIGIEVTYTTPDAAAVITEACRRHPDALVGAGTLLRAEQAEEAVAAGATYLVSPGTRADLTRALLATGAVVMSGALTPSEVMGAVGLGTTAVKLFPGSLGGPSYLKALRGPFPDVAFMPTGGVNAGNLGEWLDVGAFAVGVGGELCSAADLAEGRLDQITERAKQFRAVLTERRGA